MSPVRAVAAGLLAALLAAGHAGAQESAPPASSANATTIQETVVHGTPPDGLAGRWLAVSWLDDTNSTIAAFWQIAEEDGKPVVGERFGLLPYPPRAAYDAASGEGRRWVPSAEELAAIRAAWNSL